MNWDDFDIFIGICVYDIVLPISFAERLHFPLRCSSCGLKIFTSHEYDPAAFGFILSKVTTVSLDFDGCQRLHTK